jgi:hypothetical protein
MATNSHTQTFDQTQQTPGSAVLTALVGRLRSHVRAIANGPARATMGKDMLAAADVIEVALLDMSVQDAAAAAIVAYVGRGGAAAWKGGRR